MKLLFLLITVTLTTAFASDDNKKLICSYQNGTKNETLIINRDDRFKSSIRSFYFVDHNIEITNLSLRGLTLEISDSVARKFDAVLIGILENYDEFQAHFYIASKRDSDQIVVEMYVSESGLELQGVLAECSFN